MRLAWISGWGTDPEALRPAAQKALPQARHLFLAPRPGCIDQALAQSDGIIGWSLGAWRLLKAASEPGFAFQGPVLLLAPFAAFCAEFGGGGRCTQTQVRWLQRWLQRQPQQALADFYERAGLGGAPTALPLSVPELQEGLERLAEPPTPALRQLGLPKGWSAVVGGQDPLLDAAAVCRVLPGCQTVPQAGHGAEALLAAGLAHSKGAFHAL